MSAKRILTRCLLGLLLAFAIPAAAEMELGTNFWDIAWHKQSDCFWNWQRVQPADPWNTRFLKEIAIYRSLRFMDWDETNGSTRKTWTERNTKANPKQNPVAYEWMIDLCNRVNADMWVCIPQLAVNRNSGDQPCDYALRLCILVKTGVDMKGVDLKPVVDKLGTLTPQELIAAGGFKVCEPLNTGLRLYLEYSNETFNGFQNVWAYVRDEGVALGLDKDRDTAGHRFHAWAAVRVFRAGDLVFGAGSKRIVRVVSAFYGNPGQAREYLVLLDTPQHNPWKLKPDAIAIGPYFGAALDGAAPDVIAKMRESIQATVALCAEYKKLADSVGMRLIAYEGGQHFLNNADRINRSPVMHDMYAEYLKEMSRFFDTFSHYNHVGQAGKGGAWGSIEYTGQPLVQAHKYRALVEWSAAHQPPRK